MATNKHIIDVQTRGAKKSEKQIKGVSGALGGMAKQIGLAAAAYFGASGLINGIKSSTDAFAKQELAEKKLRFAAGASTNELIKQAQALQQTTRFGDEAIIGQQAYVKSLGVSTEQTKEIIAASVDLAAAMGISLESAVMNTTKTLSGMQGELGEKLPAAFKELTAEQLKAGDGIVFIREQFRGTAEEETQTLTGALDQMSNAFGDLQERIGERLAPALGILADKFKDIITIDPSQEAIKEKQEFEALLGILKDVNIETSTRENAIKTLKSEYSDYIGDLDLEKARLEDIEKLQTNQVAIMEKRIEQMIFAEQLRDVTEEKIRAELFLTELRMKQQEGFIEGVNRQGMTQSDWTQQQINNTLDLLETLEGEEATILALQKFYKEKTKVAVDGKKDESEATKELGKLELSVISQGTESALKSAYAEAKANLIAKIMKAVSFPYNIVAAAGAEALISSAFKTAKIQEFATGADYITNGPEMIMVGDNPSGQERVQVTPLGGDPNINGPQGGMTINIQGSVIGTEQFTEDVLMPQIEEGLRLGNRI